MTTLETSSTSAQALRRLYFIRSAFAVIWAGLLFLTSTETGPFLTVLLVIYPLFDAAAVSWQLRAAHEFPQSRLTEQINVGISVIVAIVLGLASGSIAAVLGVWGAWAIGSGILQFITAIGKRHSGGQVSQMLSGGLSVIAGVAFVGQGVRDAEGLASVGGYATLGAVFFLISAIRLSLVLRAKES